mmetsp:Transcript_109739/g.317314  ORF Transcript_109739/g.317314 Transcript_109739/m.317314 type:complete len:95 (-) Transcript_109739:204-488(-)
MQHSATQPVTSQYSQWRSDYLACRRYMGHLPSAAGIVARGKGMEYERCIQDKSREVSGSEISAERECHKCMKLQAHPRHNGAAHGIFSASFATR